MALLLGLSRLTPSPPETNDFRRNPLEAPRGRCANAHSPGPNQFFSGGEAAFVVAAVSHSPRRGIVPLERAAPDHAQKYDDGSNRNYRFYKIERITSYWT